MGAGLVGAAIDPHWSSRLSERDRLILVFMAHTANDTGNRNGVPRAEYWGGHDPLIIKLIGSLPDHGTSQYETVRKLVQRSIRALVDVGAIERIAVAHRGQQARYRLVFNFDQPTLPID